MLIIIFDMKLKTFLDRVHSQDRLRKALIRETLSKQDIYFLSDQFNEADQRFLLAKTISLNTPYFDRDIYSNWESLYS